MNQPAVIIVAGGTGERSGQKIPKQFVEICNKPIIIHCAERFFQYNTDIYLVVVCHKNYIEECQRIFQSYFPNNIIHYVEGGTTRFHSVKNGLEYLKRMNFNGTVAIHDAARPCLSVPLIQRCFEVAQVKTNAVPAIPLTESIRMLNDNGNTMVPREHFRVIQTPQCANFTTLYKAFQQEYTLLFTDEANVLESYGEKINLIDGEKNNIKITYPIDFQIAEIILSNNLYLI